MLRILVFLPELFRRHNVSVLRAFVTARKEDNKLVAIATKVDTITRTVRKSKLDYTSADGLCVTEIPEPKTVDSDVYSVPGPAVAKS